jgi:uncharacterized membrane protein YdcZ (DUF606 family)
MKYSILLLILAFVFAAFAAMTRIDQANVYFYAGGAVGAFFAWMYVAWTARRIGDGAGEPMIDDDDEMEGEMV